MAEIAAMLAGLKAGQTLTLEPRVYECSGQLRINAPGVTVLGQGATLRALDVVNRSLALGADDITLQDLTLAAPVTAQNLGTTMAAGLLVGHTGCTVRNVRVAGGASCGVMVIGAQQFTLDTVAVADTRRDGVQLSNGAAGGLLIDVSTKNTGDDGIAIISYVGKKGCHHITVLRPKVNGSKQRGLVVTGGTSIDFQDIDIANVALSGVFVGAQSYTDTVDDILVSRGTITACGGRTTDGGTGAITVLNENPNATVGDVLFEKLIVSKTPWNVESHIGHARLRGGGAITNVRYRDMTMSADWWASLFLKAIRANAPYTFDQVTSNGVPAR